MAMRKRGRENPCFICGHYHKFEEGEVCAICGHKKPEPAEASHASQSIAHLSTFPTEVLPEFLYLGSYDHASRSELLKAQGVSHILNAVPKCPNLYRTSFTYFSIPDSTTIPFDECCDFIEQARTNGARVLVHCMSGQSRSPSIVAAYLVRHQGFTLDAALDLIKSRRSIINISQGLMQQLAEFESRLRQSGLQPSSVPFTAQALGRPGPMQFDLSPFHPGAGVGVALPASGAALSVTPAAFALQSPALPRQGFVFGSANASSPGP